MLDATKAPAVAAPFQLTLLPDLDPPVTVEVRPAGKADKLAARSAARVAVRVGGDGWEGHVAYVMALAQRVILGWAGVGDGEDKPVAPTRDEVVTDPETGAVIEVIPGTISNLMNSDVGAYEAFEALYVMPLLIAEQAADAEKKGLSPSRTSSAAVARKTAGSAGKSTAKPARPARSK